MKSSKTSLSKKIGGAFPPIDRPLDSDLTVHGPACYQCGALLEEFKNERNMTFSLDRARWLVGELSLLSPSGFQWIMPSYLKAVISKDSDYDLGEFLAYYFCSFDGESDQEKHNKSFCIESLSESQVECLICVLLAYRRKANQVYYDSIDEAVCVLQRSKNTFAEQDASNH
jgi:hypothetical protein